MSDKKKLIIIVALLLLVINGGFFTLYLLYFHDSSEAEETASEKTSAAAVSEEVPAVEIDSGDAIEGGIKTLDDYYSVHFSFGDAVDLCMQEARSRNNNLVQLVLNEHSSRFQETEKQYLIKLDSYVGTPMLYDEKEHTCEIDPKTQGVAFYKEIVRRTAIRPTD